MQKLIGLTILLLYLGDRGKKHTVYVLVLEMFSVSSFLSSSGLPRMFMLNHSSLEEHPACLASSAITSVPLVFSPVS